jgi:hypothetical protein
VDFVLDQVMSYGQQNPADYDQRDVHVRVEHEETCVSCALKSPAYCLRVEKPTDPMFLVLDFLRQQSRVLDQVIDVWYHHVLRFK